MISQPSQPQQQQQQQGEEERMWMTNMVPMQM